MKRTVDPLVGGSRVLALSVGAKDAPPSPHGTDRSHGEGLRTGMALKAGVLQALGPAVARGLGFDLRAAIRGRHVRLLALHTVDGQPLPSDWAIPILPGEVVVSCAPLSPPMSGIAALIVRGAILPRPKLDVPQRERMARALAEALLAELKGRTP
jgi:hypothetical protein